MNQDKGSISVAIECCSKTCAHALTPSSTSACIHVHVLTVAVFFLHTAATQQALGKSVIPLIPPTRYITLTRAIAKL